MESQREDPTTSLKETEAVPEETEKKPIEVEKKQVKPVKDKEKIDFCELFAKLQAHDERVVSELKELIKKFGTGLDQFGTGLDQFGNLLPPAKPQQNPADVAATFTFSLRPPR